MIWARNKYISLSEARIRADEDMAHLDWCINQRLYRRHLVESGVVRFVKEIYNGYGIYVYDRWVAPLYCDMNKYDRRMVVNAVFYTISAVHNAEVLGMRV